MSAYFFLVLLYVLASSGCAIAAIRWGTVLQADVYSALKDFEDGLLAVTAALDTADETAENKRLGSDA